MEAPIDISQKRAGQALKCLPFSSVFYREAEKTGLDADEVYVKPHKYGVKGKRWFSSPNKLEGAFIWLIKVGILRREVDGQGLTSKVRVTPLCRQLIKKNPHLPSQSPTILEIINHWAKRHWPRQ